MWGCRYWNSCYLFIQTAVKMHTYWSCYAMHLKQWFCSSSEGILKMRKSAKYSILDIGVELFPSCIFTIFFLLWRLDSKLNIFALNKDSWNPILMKNQRWLHKRFFPNMYWCYIGHYYCVITIEKRCENCTLGHNISCTMLLSFCTCMISWIKNNFFFKFQNFFTIYLPLVL